MVSVTREKLPNHCALHIMHYCTLSYKLLISSQIYELSCMTEMYDCRMFHAKLLHSHNMFFALIKGLFDSVRLR